MAQRRYDGPSVIYLGAGAVLTAGHVGMGEILLEDEIFAPDFVWRHTLLNENGTGADAMLFRLQDDVEWPDLPLVPIATEPPLPGEDILLIGFGRKRAKVIEWEEAGHVRFGFEWTAKGSKRWGTNQVTASRQKIVQTDTTTESFRFRFDVPRSFADTAFEAQASVGDSGGAVFVLREEEWLLAGMMISVSTEPARPADTTIYGDTTFAADLSYYREEIMRWARPACSNELDDDGDEKIDFPIDSGCHSAIGRDERDTPSTPIGIGTAWAIGASGLGLVLVTTIVAIRRREPR